MLREAELFRTAEDVLVEVLGRIREADADLVLPPMHGASSDPVTVREAVRQHVADDTRLTTALGGRPSQGEPTVGAAAAAACAAAEQVDDGDAQVDVGDGPLPVRDLLLLLAVRRSLLAHYVATHLGSTACPLPEELARPLWELTAPDAERWRRRGDFRAPMPLPAHVSWRDRFLLTAGHLPHPLGH